jgi:hypothetical protein
MFLRHPFDIRELSAMLHGYTVCQLFHKIHEDNVPNFRKFSNWLFNKHNMDWLSLGWAVAILRENKNDMEKALSSFFNYIDEFLSDYKKN